MKLRLRNGEEIFYYPLLCYEYTVPCIHSRPSMFPSPLQQETLRILGYHYPMFPLGSVINKWLYPARQRPFYFCDKRERCPSHYRVTRLDVTVSQGKLATEFLSQTRFPYMLELELEEAKGKQININSFLFYFACRLITHDR